MNQSTQRIIRNKIGLLNLAEELGNVSKACQMMGVSRDTFYRYQSARDEGGVDALLEKSRRKANPKNRVEPQVEQSVLDFALEYPAHGQVRVSNELRKTGVFVSPSGVRSIWLRHTLQSRKLRLKALEAKVAKEDRPAAASGSAARRDFVSYEDMTNWQSTSEPVDRGRRYELKADGAPLSFRSFLRLLRDEDSFADWYRAELAAFPAAAVYWELPPLTMAGIDRAAEYVLLEAPALEGISPDPRPFAEHFDGFDDEVIVFRNLGGDALLVVPAARAADSAYPHLAPFLRHAPPDQIRALWRRTAETLTGRLGDAPLWLSTAGGGVNWLHLRIDTVPKYYSHAPFRRP